MSFRCQVWNSGMSNEVYHETVRTESKECMNLPSYCLYELKKKCKCKRKTSYSLEEYMRTVREGRDGRGLVWHE